MLDNPRSERIKKVAALSGRSARKKAGLILVEGPQAVGELLRFRPDSISDVYFTQSFADRHPDLYEGIRREVRWFHLVSDQVARKISAESQGVAAVASATAIGGQGEPLEDELGAVASGSGFMVILPETQDPGNLGTMIRTADAMGAAAVVLGHGTCEVGNPKVIRSSAGSVFHLPVYEEDFGRLTALARERGITVLGTALSDASKSLPAMLEDGELARAHAWVFGNEARGLSDEQRELCDVLVHIPMAGAAESLNVAASASMCLFASSLAAGVPAESERR